MDNKITMFIKARSLLFVLLLCLSYSAVGQSVTIKGNVKDEKGAPIIGASVVQQNTVNGTVTNTDGNFVLQVPPTAVLTVSYVGYNTQVIPITGGKTLINVILTEDTKTVEEVVVIGYGVMKKSDLTGAISQVSSKDLQKQSSPNLGSALQGRAAGLQVISSGAPGSNVNLKIRGYGSINNSDPLLVIDGVPTDAPLNMLNMDDVESVDVLKDASATAIYGSRGAYGVIIITTKRGRTESGKLGIKASYGIDQAIRTIPLLNATQFASLHNEMMTANGKAQNPMFRDPESLTESTDWVSYLFRTAPTQNYSLNYTGGNEKTSYYVSGSIYNQSGIVHTTGYKRYTVQFNMDTKPMKWLKFGNNITMNHDVKSSGEVNIIGAMISLPTQPLKNADGTWSGPIGLPMYVGDKANPIGKMYLNSETTKGYNVLGNVYAEVKPVEWLQIRSTVGLQALFWDSKNWNPKYDFQPIAQVESYASRRYNKSLTTLWDNTATFMKTFAQRHSLNVMVGTSAQTNTFEFMNGSIQGFISPTAQQLDNGSLNPLVGGNGSDWALLSFMGRANYSFDNRYLVTATIRRDGSSRFSKENRWSNFPSLSLAWRLSEEKFFKKSFWLSDLKFRFGYGITGNQASVSNYAYASNAATVQYVFNGTQVNGIAPVVMPNPNVRWEEVEQYNVGADLSMFDSRLSLSVDAYIKNTNDMLVDMTVPISTGYSDIIVPKINAGQMRNKGIELSVSSRNMVGEFKWNTSVNVSYNNNKILKLNGEVPIYFDRNTHSVNHSISTFYGYVTDGIFQTQKDVDDHAIQTQGNDVYNRTSAGDVRFKDLNNDGVINDQDQTYLGSPIPNWSFSMNNALEWKGFDLEIFIQGVAGNKIYNVNRSNLEAMSIAQNQWVGVLDRWRGEGTSNSMPRAVFGDPNKNSRTSDRFIEDGSYLRLKNVALGYTLPSKLTQKIKMSSVRFFVSGQNLVTLTRYTGLDPEVSGSANDNNVYPVSRNITFGANISF